MTSDSRAEPGSGWAELAGFARRYSPYYRRLYERAPERPAYLQDLPMVDPDDFWAAHRREGNEILSGPHHDGMVFRSGGTTGLPKTTLYTREELRATIACTAASMIIAGLRPGDRVANLLSAGDMYLSFLHVTYSLRECPVPVVELPIAAHTDLDNIARILREQTPGVIFATPSFLVRLAAHLRARGLVLPGPRLLLYAGEALYADQRALLNAAYPHAEPHPFAYVTADVGVLATPVPDQDDPRLYRTNSPHTILEIVDPDTGRPISEPGRTGRVVATNLLRRLMPVIRYPVGDLAEWSDPHRGLLRLLGRSSDHARVGTAKISFVVLNSHLTEIMDSKEPPLMQIVLRRHHAKDELLVRVAAQVDDPAACARALHERLQSSHPPYRDHIARNLIHPVAVEWTTVDRLQLNPRTSRVVPVIDERDHQGGPGEAADSAGPGANREHR
ncbi:phenylacetate--CoA ligase family protein [Streptomyces sp. QH1-20]|uniref:phenylacetate--CoA ligase family protein n=1 Tax=Streptomyces sp. QH1-20 TaxID=3240934 RepID=UPI00351245A4